MKFSLSKCFLFIAIIVIVVMACFMYNFSNEKNILENEILVLKEKINSLEHSIPTEDLFAVDYNEIGASQSNPYIVKISNGDLYYLDKNKIDTIKYYSPCEEDYIKIDSNVKRIKSLTLGTDTSIDYLIIKNDGSVKSLIGKTIESYDKLKDYTVEDIIDFDGKTFTLKLLDGTIKQVS